MSLIARRLSVRGRVQGVGFRHALVVAARAAGVDGWVRNCRDGSVEAFVQGDGSAVLALIGWCERGPSGAQVSDVEVVDTTPDTTLAGFAQRASA